MSQGFKGSDDSSFYFFMFICVLLALLLVVAYKYMIFKAPDINTPAGRCEAFCAGIPGGKVLGYEDNFGEITKCFCDNRIRPDKMLLKRP